MDNRAIGVFDSGLGGLTAAKELMRLMPRENIIYFGDTGRVPYGSRSRETIIKYTRQAIDFLLGFPIKLIVIACGTASSVASEIFNNYTIPVIGVVEPSALAVAAVSRGGRIGITATQASIRMRAYEDAIRNLMPSASILSRAAPLLVPLIENGHNNPGDPVTELLVEEYLRDIRAFGVDTLLMGCTHYPLLADFMRDFMGDEVALIDSGAVTALFVKETLHRMDMEADIKNENIKTNSKPLSIYISDIVENFSQIASMFLDINLDGVIEKVDIENLSII